MSEVKNQKLEIRNNNFVNSDQLSASHKFIQHSKFNIQNLLLIVILIIVSSCGVYNFTGGGTGCAKTISIQNFSNEAGGGPANLSQLLTEKLRDYYQQNTKLSLVNTLGDWQFDGRITRYEVLPLAPTQNEKAGLNRLTIKVAVNFINTKETDASCQNEVKSCEGCEFSFYEDFPQNQTLSQVEADLVNKISDRIVFDIYTKTTSNW
ncbi:MAG: hypothetical protein K2X86_00915 [Cytophagaceae bacterium]|nr:hypothetical protein [Cytophagaceae bacterium]